MCAVEDADGRPQGRKGEFARRCCPRGLTIRSRALAVFGTPAIGALCRAGYAVAMVNVTTSSARSAGHQPVSAGFKMVMRE
ncbi:MAG: hypothetical protein JWQ95_2340 [Sphaerisporangium sp.]|nr:hypothetical protein [Sphaerisporangium sp.]